MVFHPAHPPAAVVAYLEGVRSGLGDHYHGRDDVAVIGVAVVRTRLHALPLPGDVLSPTRVAVLDELPVPPQVETLSFDLHDEAFLEAVHKKSSESENVVERQECMHPRGRRLDETEQCGSGSSLIFVPRA